MIMSPIWIGVLERTHYGICSRTSGKFPILNLELLCAYGVSTFMIETNMQKK